MEKGMVMGDFKWAIRQMGQGKKVKRASFKDNSRYLWMTYNDVHQGGDERCISDSKYTTFDIELRDIEAEDWEIYEEKRENLSKMQFTIAAAKLGFRTPIDLYFYEEKDVKEFVKKILEEVFESEAINGEIWVRAEDLVTFAKKIRGWAGDKLI